MKGIFLKTVIGLFIAGAVISHANATVFFFTDEAAFSAASTTTLIDFEGIAPDDDFSPTSPASAITIGSVVFSGIANTGISNADVSTIVCGKDACTGNPHNSAILVSSFAHDLTVDLSNAGTGHTAIGGYFGDIDGGGGSATLELLGTGGAILDTQQIDIAGLMGPEPDDLRFFGWLSSSEEITGLNFKNNDDTNGEINFEAVDDFRFGQSVGLEIPEPAALALFGFGLAGLHLMGRRRRV